MVELSPRQLKTLTLLKNELPVYSEQCLRTKVKGESSTGVVPVKFNRVQRHLHERCEAQKKKHGWVRIALVKGRQQTCSTYVASRYFHAAQMYPGTNVYILSHESKSTDALFDKVEVFNSELIKSLPFLAHGIVTENRSAMEFTNRSSYGVGTAGAENTGRGLTINRFHGSECAFWQNVQNIRTGALQTVALVPGTEVILESTCNGINWWYTFCMEALNGEGVYELVFIPWYWTDEYRLEPSEGFFRTQDEIELCNRVANYTDGTDWILDDAQLMWRRAKIVELESLAMFKQEYPCDLQEAFQASGEPYFESDLVQAALANELPDDTVGALILGVDPGRKGDRTIFTERGGRVIEKVTDYGSSMDSERLAGLISERIDQGVDHCFLDVAMGYGALDILRARGYGQFVTPVDFGQSPIDEKYANKRAEMACLFNKWLLDAPVSIRTSGRSQQEHRKQAQQIAADIAMMPQPKPTSNSRILFPSKEEMRKQFKRSPDILDSIMLTFAFPVKGKGFAMHTTQTQNTQRGSSLTARRRVTETEVKQDPFELRFGEGFNGQQPNSNRQSRFRRR